ncbi:MAG: sugar phosphate nucleotidyltransferase [Vicinamibacterales bacterium]
MKAILLAGGMGTRLRPLTLHVPKPVVPIFNRPFLHYQLDRLKHVSEIDEVRLSLNYRPDAIERVFGDGSGAGIRIRYCVEPEPLGTGGAIRFSGHDLQETVVVFNGDVLTEIDLGDVIRLHRARRARATIVLTPVENPSAYGLVETDADGNVRRFVEKPDPSQITTNLINAGIYVLEPETFDRIPAGQPYSIERGYFPSLVERGETFVAYAYRGYWLDIGTPAAYRQVHRDIMDGRFHAAPFPTPGGDRRAIDPAAQVDPAATITAPCFIDHGARIAAGATVGPHAVIGRDVVVEAGATVTSSILWPGTHVGAHARLTDTVLATGSRVGAHAATTGLTLGPDTHISDYSR